MPKLSNFLKDLDNFVTIEEARAGCVVEVLGPGELTEPKGTFKAQLVLPVELNGEERSLGLNGSTVRDLAAKYGDDTKEWVGKRLRLFTKKYGANEGRAAEWTE